MRQSSRSSNLLHRAWVRNVCMALLLFLVYFGVRAYQLHDLARGPAPTLDVELLDGARFTLTGEARPTLVYFWATWCPVCRFEHAAVDAIAADHRVVAVAMQSGTDAELAGYLHDHPWRVPTHNDLTGEQVANWGVRATPTFFIADRQGQIRYREAGYTTEFGLRFRLWLAS